MYKVVGSPGNGLLFIESKKYGRQLWSHGKTTYKKRASPCAICGSAISIWAYRPVSNASNRMERICENCGEKEANPNA